MSYELIRADASAIPLEDDSIDVIATSPPYFSLRDYSDEGGSLEGQIGSEPTMGEFLEALWAVTAECKRVLKPSGSMFVNLGDKYSGSGGNNQSGVGEKAQSAGPSRYNQDAGGVPRKSLMGIPWRYALGCVDDLGLILRAEIVWAKKNGLPESVTDRVRRSHEQFFHMTKEPRYFSGVDEIREPHEGERHAPGNKGEVTAEQIRGTAQASKGVSGHLAEPDRVWGNPLGKLPGSVWEIPTSPLIVPEELEVDHYAAFPPEWPRRLILGWSPSGVCVACQEGRRPVVATSGLDESRPQARRALELVAEHGLTDEHIAAIRSVGVSDTGRGEATQNGTGGNTDEVYRLADEARTALGGYAREFLLSRPTSLGYACACPDTTAPTTPARILDPFCGTGTTVAAAHALGRHGIGIDLSSDYLRLAEWRINHDKRFHDMRADFLANAERGTLDALVKRDDPMLAGSILPMF